MSCNSAAAVMGRAAEHSVLVLDAPAPAASVVAGIAEALPSARIAHAADRQHFGECLRTPGWSLVVVAFDLEDYAGLDALDDVKLAIHAPVIALGTAPAAAAVVAALRNGAADFIDRSRLHELHAAVVRCLAGSAASGNRTLREDRGRFVQAAAWWADRDAILLLDKDWVVAESSRGVSAVLGYAPKELVGQPIEALFGGIASSDLLDRLRAWRGPELFREGAWMKRRDGLRLWAEMTCVAEVGPDGQARRFGLRITDATLQYRASQAMRNQADTVAAVAAARNLFLGSVAHEMRAALAPIATSAQLLERRPADATRHARCIEIIQGSVATAARLVDDLLTFSTVSENKLSIRLAQVDVHRLLAECADAVGQQAATAAVTLGLDLQAGEEEAQLECDRDRIRQVIANLLGNAIKFTPPGGTVTLRTASESNALVIEVIDSGIGIDPAALPFIFDPFEQGGAGVTTRYGGYGLGLAVCAAIARQHGGELLASSAGPGRGATFRLSLPFGGIRPTHAARGVRDGVPLHVLYVEDNPDAADAMRYALRTLGWAMTHAPTCARARDLVRAGEGVFDVMLADLGLPDGSGVDLGNELSRHLPVVALSAYGAPMAMEGFANQLIKPAEISEVQRSLLQAVAAHRSSLVR